MTDRNLYAHADIIIITYTVYTHHCMLELHAMLILDITYRHNKLVYFLVIISEFSQNAPNRVYVFKFCWGEVTRLGESVANK